MSILPSNNNLEIVGKLHLDHIKSVEGCPKKSLPIEEQKIHILQPSRGIFEETISMNRPEGTVFYLVNLCQISEEKLTGRSLGKAARVGG